MRVHGAVIREQGLDFAVVIVKQHIVRHRSQGEQLISAFNAHFGMPVVLMAQDTRGTPTYLGRPDIVRFLAGVPLQAIPWRVYDLN